MSTRSRWRLPLLAVAALAAGAALGGGTLALWNGTALTPGAVINAGNLEITATATAAPEWRETSDDVDAPQSGTFLVRQGDTATADFPFTTVLDGDNLAANIGINWTTAPTLPAGVTARFDVVDSSDATIGSGVLGTNDAALARVTAGGDYLLRVELDFSGLSDRFGAGSPVQITDLGEFDVTLAQTRSGGGFQ